MAEELFKSFVCSFSSLSELIGIQDTFNHALQKGSILTTNGLFTEKLTFSKKMCQTEFENIHANGSWDVCDNFMTFCYMYCEDNNMLLYISAATDPFSRNPCLVVDKTSIGLI